jgi:hypothetical protein
MFTRALLLLACCLSALYAGWPRPSLLGLSALGGGAISEQEWCGLNLWPDSLEQWSGQKVIYLPDRRIEGPARHSRCLRRDCLVQAGRSAGVDRVLSGSVENLNGRWLVAWRLISLREDHREKVQVCQIPAGDTKALRDCLRDWLRDGAPDNALATREEIPE